MADRSRCDSRVQSTGVLWHLFLMRFLQGELQNSLHSLNFVENFLNDNFMRQKSSVAQVEAGQMVGPQAFLQI